MVASVVIGVAPAAPAEDALTYRGRTLDAWIEDLGRSYAPSVREEAAQVLGSFPGPRGRVVAALIAALGDSASGVRREAAISLGRIGPPDASPAVAALARTADDTFEDAAEAAVRALERIGPDASAAVPALRKALREDRLAPAAIRALGAIGPRARAAVPDLTDLARGRDESLAGLARAAIERIRDE